MLEGGSSTLSVDVEPPTETSGFAKFLQLAPVFFILLNLVLFVTSSAVSFLGGRCESVTWRGAVLVVLLFILEMAYCMYLVFSQLQVFHHMQQSTEELTVQQTELLAQLGPQEAPQEELYRPRSWFSLPKCLGINPVEQTQDSGYYYLQKRNEVGPSHFQLLRRHYNDYLQYGPCSAEQAFYVFIGLVQALEMAANAVQPGLLRTCVAWDTRGGFLARMIHEAWLSLLIFVVVGLLQFTHFRWLMRNALATTSGEKEWLACDLLQGERKDSNFHAALDTDPGDGSIASLSQQMMSNTSRGRLNLTYAWMCAAGAAEAFGATHLAEMCDKLAHQTKIMVEGSSNYRFRFRHIAEWDIRKMGMFCRLIQAFFLVITSVELLGVSSLHHVRAFATTAILLGALTVSWKTALAVKFCRSEDVAQGGRSTEVGVAACLLLLIALLTWLCAGLGISLRYGRCADEGFSLLHWLTTRQLSCGVPGALR